MKHMGRRFTAIALTFVMIVGLLQVSIPVVKAAETTTNKKIDAHLSSAVKVENGDVYDWTFPNLQVTGDDIKSISIQFTTAVIKGDKISLEVPAEYSSKGISTEVKVNNSGTHVVLNAKSATTTVSKETWQELLREQLKVSLADDNTRGLSFVVSSELQDRIIEYNYYNGHYYEVVENCGAVTWADAYKKAQEGIPYLKLNPYLANITSEQENDFVVSICKTDTWLGATCDPEYTGHSDSINRTGGSTSRTGTFTYYFVNGDEKGEIMSTCEVSYGTPTSITPGSVMEDGYTNWGGPEGGAPTEPNVNYGTEYYQCMYAKENTESWKYPTMWNDWYADYTLDSYVVEYGTAEEIKNMDKSLKTDIVLNSGEGEANALEITAHDFMLSVNEAASLTESGSKSSSDVAVTGELTMVTSDKISVDSDDLKAIQDMGQAKETGNHEITYSYTGITTGMPVYETVTAYVVDQKQLGTTDGNKVYIGADNFVLTATQAAEVTGHNNDALLKEYASVVALENNIKVEDMDKITVVTNNISTTPDSYAVTFSYGYVDSSNEGIKVTVLATVLGASVTASDFILSVEEAKELTADNAKQEANVAGEAAGSTIANADITVNTEQLNAIIQAGKDAEPDSEGKDLTFSYQDTSKDIDESDTVKVYITDEKTEQTDSTSGTVVEIGANDFAITVVEAENKDMNVNKELFKQYAGVVALDNGIKVDDLTKISINTDAVQAVPSDTGYDVTFTYDGVSVTVKAKVKELSLDANDFIVGLDSVKALTDADVKDKADVEVKDGDSDAALEELVADAKVNATQLKELQNTKEPDKKEISFTYTNKNGDKVQDSVTAYVVDSASASEDNTVSIGANNFNITVEEAQRKNEASFQKLFKQYAEVIAKDNGVTIDDYSKFTIDVSDITEQTGSHDVIFTYSNGTKTVSVTVKATVVNPAIFANDFIVALDKVESLTEAQVRGMAEVSGTDTGVTITDLTKIKADAEDLQSLKAITKPGSQDLEFTYTNNNGGYASDVARVYVKEAAGTGTDDNGNTVSVGANDFSITVAEASNKNNNYIQSLFKNYAAALALDNGIKVNDISEIGINVDAIRAAGGSYDVIFTYKTATATVKATVAQTQITANDFVISKEQAENKDAIADELKELAAVLATELDQTTNTIKNVPSSDITIKQDTIQPENGFYDITFAYGDETVTVKVTVKDNETTNAEKGTTISSNNITVGANDEENDNTMTPEEFLTEADVEASYIEGEKIPSYDLTVDEEQLNKVNEAIETGEKGNYLVDVKTPDGTKTTVTVTVTNESSKETSTKETIAANDFTIGINDYKLVSGENELKNIIKLSNAVAYDTDTKADVEITKVVSAIENKAGVYDVTLSTAKGTSVTVKATISNEWKTIGDVDKASESNETQETTDNETAVKKDTGSTDPAVTIIAKDFIITKEQAEKKDEIVDTLKELAKLSVTADGQDIPNSSVAIDTTNIQPKNGSYDVAFTYENETVTVKAIVKDNDTTNTTTGTDISSNNITVGSNDLSTPEEDNRLAEDDFKKEADVIASTKDGTEIPSGDLVVDKDALDKVNEAIETGKKGDYPVDVTAPDGTKTTVVVTVTDEQKKDTDKKETIAANNFTIGIEDYALVSGNDKLTNVIKLSNAAAYDTATKADVAITNVDTSKVQNKAGTYDVTLSTANGTSITVKATINDDWKTIGNVDKASDANKTQDTTSNDTAVKNDAKTPDGTTQPDSTTAQPDATTQAPAITDTVGVDKVFEKTNPIDVTQDIDKTKVVKTVTVNGKEVPAGDYAKADGVLTIGQDYLGSMAVGTYPVVVTYSDGSKLTFNIKVIEYDVSTVIKKVPILKMNKSIGVKSKFKLNLVGINSTAVKSFKSSNKKIATVNSSGVIVGKKKGKCVITANIIQNGSYYKVKVNITVKAKMKIYNLKNAALSKKSGDLPEFNVYKRVFKGKKTKLSFTNVEKDAVVKYSSKNKKIATVTKKGVITGKKKGFTVVTAKITQNGKTYVTRIFVRVDDKTKQKVSKYLKVLK